jgi:hypothetical protein
MTEGPNIPKNYEPSEYSGDTAYRYEIHVLESETLRTYYIHTFTCITHSNILHMLCTSNNFWCLRG